MAPRVATVGAVTTLVIAVLLLGFLGLLVVGFVAFPYRGRRVPEGRIPTGRLRGLAERSGAWARRVAPGEAPPLGVLTSPEKSRAMSARFERAEEQVRRAMPTGRR